VNNNGKHRIIDAAAPPHDLDAERYCNAAKLRDPSLVLANRLTATDFFDVDQGIIHDAIHRRFESGDPMVDVPSLWLELKNDPQLSHVDTKVELAELLAIPLSAESYPPIESRILELSRRRRLMKLGRDLADAAMTGEDMTGLLAAAEAELGSTAPAASGFGARWTRLDTVLRQSVGWFWPARIPLGKITLFFGDPGIGKSFVTLYLAAQASTGGRWPDGTGNAPRGTTIILNCEDANDDTNCPRLDAMGADTSKIISLDSIRTPGTAGKVIERPFALADVNHLADLIRKNPDTNLVIIDPVSGFLNGADGHKNSDIRGLLAPLAKLAEEFHVAVVLVNHMNKSGGKRAMYRAMDSLAFIAAARAAWVFLEDPEQPDSGRVLFLPAKSNLAKPKGGLAYTITESGAVRWETVRIDRKADDVLADAAGEGAVGRPANERAAAERWLAAYLADGEEHPAADVQKDATAAGFNQKTTYRASVKLGIVKQRSQFGGKMIWRTLRTPK
jgi:hypothetical protein